MFSNNPDFYPTPPELIEKMLEPYWRTSRDGTYRYLDINGDILEPEAGKGDIPEYIREHKHYNMRDDANYYVIEKEKDLQFILQEKNCKVIASDFLTYENDRYFDYIIMNPPFSNGDEHLLKAIEIGTDTDIVCLLNAETIRNPYTPRRKQLIAEIEKWGGTIEYIQNAFSTAERKTNVEIALIRLHVTREDDRFDFGMVDEKIDLNFDSDILQNEIARNDYIGNLIHIYEKAREKFIVMLKAERDFYHYARQLTKNAPHDFEMRTTGDYKHQYSFLSVQLKSVMWHDVISYLDLDKFMSYSLRQKFKMQIKHQANMAFTKEATQEFFEMIIMNSGNILDAAIVEVFDYMTKHYNENRMFVEGWKTNSAWKVNRKVIIPNGVDMSWHGNDAKRWGANFKMGCNYDKYSDIDKVMCYLTGKKLEEIVGIFESLDTKFKKIGKVFPGDKFDNNCESEFFKIKFWRKGTMHLEFKDEYLWKEFNIRATKGKMWLPEEEYKSYQQSKTKSDPNKSESTSDPLQLNQGFDFSLFD